MRTAPSEPAPTRRSRSEIRALMMEAGQAILVEQGLGVGAQDLTFKRVFDRVAATHGIRLTNASVIRRAWENQAEFQDDVLLSVAVAGDAGDESAVAAGALLPLLASADLTSLEGRRAAMTEVCRVAGRIGLEALVSSPSWSLWVGVWVLAVTGPESERGLRIRQALLDGYEATTGLWMDVHGALAAHLGFRVRWPFDLRHFTVSVGALVEGCALRQGAERGTPPIVRPTGPDGELQEWNLFGMGLEALTMQYFEPDPGWVPPAPEGAT